MAASSNAFCAITCAKSVVSERHSSHARRSHSFSLSACERARQGAIGYTYQGRHMLLLRAGDSISVTVRLPFRDGDAMRKGGDGEPSHAPRGRRDRRLLPSRLSRSVPESHRVSPRLAAGGSRTVTAGGDLHPAPKTCSSADYEYRTAGKRHGRWAGYQSVRRSSAYEERGSRLANCLSSVATATASPK